MRQTVTGAGIEHVPKRFNSQAFESIRSIGIFILEYFLTAIVPSTDRVQRYSRSAKRAITNLVESGVLPFGPKVTFHVTVHKQILPLLRRCFRVLAAAPFTLKARFMLPCHFVDQRFERSPVTAWLDPVPLKKRVEQLRAVFPRFAKQARQVAHCG